MRDNVVARMIVGMGCVACLTFANSGCRNSLAFHKPPAEQKPIAKISDTTKFNQHTLSPRQAAEACIVTANELENAGHLREAIAMYKKAQQKAPKVINYSRRLAVLYDHVGDPENASLEYAKALKQDSKDPELLNDFGYFQLRRGELTSAENYLRQATKANPELKHAWINLGIVLAHLDRNKEAHAAFARVVGPAAAHSNVGAVLAKRGRTEQSKSEFRKALELNPHLQQPIAFLTYFDKSSMPESDSSDESKIVRVGYAQNANQIEPGQ